MSVANEIPVDVVRFYGSGRIERFLEELLGLAKQKAPKCLVTYVNFPTTEFLQPAGLDFYCFNVYVHDEVRLGAYLDRLSTSATNRSSWASTGSTACTTGSRSRHACSTSTYSASSARLGGFVCFCLYGRLVHGRASD